MSHTLGIQWILVSIYCSRRSNQRKTSFSKITKILNVVFKFWFVPNSFWKKKNPWKIPSHLQMNSIFCPFLPPLFLFLFKLKLPRWQYSKAFFLSKKMSLVRESLFLCLCNFFVLFVRVFFFLRTQTGKEKWQLASLKLEKVWNENCKGCLKCERI